MKESKFPQSFLLKSILIVIPFLLYACGGENKPTQKNNAVQTTIKPKITVPDFNADSAYAFVEKQLSFGPRVPGSDAHKACASWLETELKRFTDHVIVQEFKSRIYNNEIFDGKNIIASFKPEIKNRVF
nr:glutamine cyclotransferase [Bacteroidota bacterium]